MGIPGSGRAGERAKFFTKVVGSEVLTEGGLNSNSWPGGRVARWSRRVATRYTHCRTGKGNLKGWREIGKEDGEECRWCGGKGNTSSSGAKSFGGRRPRGDRSRGRGRTWTTRGGSFWTLVQKEGGKEGEMEEGDLVEEFFHWIQDPL